MRQRSCDEIDVEAVPVDAIDNDDDKMLPARWRLCRLLRILCVIAALGLGVWTLATVVPATNTWPYAWVAVYVVAAAVVVGSLWWCATRRLAPRLRRRRRLNGPCCCVVQ
ncbi:hypothetical protein pqer_cds_1059 [Pandoravirus quercus]|uniref:Transmembrane protein n=1 Tax=Pandoravirus quercus TaxID=2107709 RepID=A0A2U7UAK9_9VIRU|nr:hypothetical protein pqer_cds_1059 [Pandoravirus quercus]AVK75481.1 hypothetical protein pqer_cds_1059 [Pandoravirus quercus]